MFAEVKDYSLRCQQHRSVEQLVRVATFGLYILFCSGCLLFVLGILPLSVCREFALSTPVVFPWLVSVVFVSSFVSECNIQIFRVFLSVFQDRFESFGSLSFLKSFNYQLNFWVLTVYYVVSCLYLCDLICHLDFFQSLVSKYLASVDSLTNWSFLVI